MKKSFWVIVFCGFLLITLTGCGSPNHEKLKDTAEVLEITTLFKEMGDNVATAEKKYGNNYYKIDISVMNMEKNSFEYMFRADDGNIYNAEVFLSQDELATLKNSTDITIIGKIKIKSKQYVQIKSAFIVYEDE